MRRGIAAAALALIAAAGPALAQRADRPDIRIGDRWQFATVPSSKARITWIVTSVTPESIVGTENGARLLLTPELNVIESPRRQDTDGRRLSFPLEVGKAWGYVSDYRLKDTGVNGRGDYSVTVLGREKIRVPAGEFEAFKLASRGTFSAMSPRGPVSGLVSATYWYAPAARAIVKEVVRDSSRGVYGYQLVAFKLQP